MSRAKATSRTRSQARRVLANLDQQYAAIEQMDIDDMAAAIGQTPAEVRAGLREAIALGFLRVEAISDTAVVLRGTFPNEETSV